MPANQQALPFSRMEGSYSLSPGACVAGGSYWVTQVDDGVTVTVNKHTLDLHQQPSGHFMTFPAEVHACGTWLLPHRAGLHCKLQLHLAQVGTLRKWPEVSPLHQRCFLDRE
jgi:hypothetical protein